MILQDIIFYLGSARWRATYLVKTEEIHSKAFQVTQQKLECCSLQPNPNANETLGWIDFARPWRPAV